jgi:DNA segregation ATPase FtsK/SpoIIIE-like protein
MLVAGATRSGKSMFLYTLIGSLARLNAPERLHLLLIDPKRTDFGFFRRLPHLHGRGVITDPAEAVAALTDLINGEMERRTDLLEEEMYLNIGSYNQAHPESPLPLIVVVIDEFADLADVMESKEQREEFDLALRRLAQRARSVGIHLVIATQRPTADIINGTIKANLPGRVSFRLGSGVDSRTILDEGGAEHLLGYGDMLLKDGGQTARLQGFFLDEADLRTLVLAITKG